MTRSSPKEINYLFVDGGYFRKVIEKVGNDFFSTDALPIDYRAFASRFTKVFYYDCIPPKKSKEPEEEYEVRVRKQRSHFQQLRLLDGWHVFEGVIVGTGRNARQKQVDILIAVDMLTHSYKRNMHQISFIAGDQDFKPLVDALVRDGMFVELWHDPVSSSKELVYAADSRRRMDVYNVHSFLPRQFQKDNPLPVRSGQSGRDVSDASLIDRGSGIHGEIELYERNGEYIVLHPDENNVGYFLHVRWHDLDTLKRIYESAYGDVQWEHAI